MTVHVFAGPSISAAEIEECAPGAVRHPPVAHGDLLRIGLVAGDVVVIVDGYYHQAAPVRHKEILHLIASGVAVIGCGSMGALRAAELHPCGMVGSGTVFAMYRDGEIDADDEVAVAHRTDDGFGAMNMPLVNVRVAARSAADAGSISVQDARDIVAATRALHYTDRTWPAITASIRGRGGDPGTVAALRSFLQEHPEHADAKRRDAVDTLRRVDEIARTAAGTIAEPSWANELIFAWQVEFEGRDVAGRWVCDGDVLRYQQLYSPDFPALWVRFALDAVGADTRRRAPVPPSVVADYLGPDETAGAATAEIERRICVLAFTPVRGLYDLRAFAPHLVEDARARQAVAEARSLNDEVMWRPTVRLVDRLSTDRLERHLRDLWRVGPDDDRALLTACRERGFASIGDAVTAVRLFFLRDDRTSGGRSTSRWSKS